MRPFAIVRAGSAPDPVRAVHGDFVEWFEGLLAPAPAAIVDAESGPLPDARDFAGVVVTGSMKSVTAPEAWMDALGAWLVSAAAHGTPVLGVCFGHQLLAHALGGRVTRNPAGPEAGTCEVELTDAGARDPLFAGAPRRLAVQQAHEDHVATLPPGAILLARGDRSPVQAFAHGPNLRAVQFHPEFDAARCAAMCEADRPMLESARPGSTAEALASVRETPYAESLLRSWARRAR